MTAASAWLPLLLVLFMGSFMAAGVRLIDFLFPAAGISSGLVLLAVPLVLLASLLTIAEHHSEKPLRALPLAGWLLVPVFTLAAVAGEPGSWIARFSQWPFWGNGMLLAYAYYQAAGIAGEITRSETTFRQWWNTRDPARIPVSHAGDAFRLVQMRMLVILAIAALVVPLGMPAIADGWQAMLILPVAVHLFSGLLLSALVEKMELQAEWQAAGALRDSLEDPIGTWAVHALLIAALVVLAAYTLPSLPAWIDVRDWQATPGEFVPGKGAEARIPDRPPRALPFQITPGPWAESFARIFAALLFFLAGGVLLALAAGAAYLAWRSFRQLPGEWNDIRRLAASWWKEFRQQCRLALHALLKFRLARRRPAGPGPKSGEGIRAIWNRSRKKDRRAWVRRLYGQFLTRAAKAGVPRLPGETPLEFARRFERHMPSASGEQVRALHHLTEIYMHVRYGGVLESRDGVMRSRRLWKTLVRAFRTARMKGEYAAGEAALNEAGEASGDAAGKESTNVK